MAGCVSFFGAAAVAQSPHPVGRPAAIDSSSMPAHLSLVAGSVKLEHVVAAKTTQPTPGNVPPPPQDQEFPHAQINMPVLPGMAVRTGDDGRAEIQFPDGSIARLAPNSAVSVISLEAGREQLRAEKGLTYYELPDQTTGVLTIIAGPDHVRLDQNALLRVDLDSEPYGVAVLRGSAHFNNVASDIGFEVNEGETARLDPSSPGKYEITKEIAGNSWDDWNTDRDSMLAELAESQTNARAGSNDADSDAWNDLDYYGTWYDVPGEGMAWAPDGVDASFDPYGQGSWGYYSGVGYTWISAYPWGWLPYRCGGWNYFNGFGWGWQPGGACGGFQGAGWYPYTGVHHRPGNYRIPAQPLDPRLRSRLGGAPLPRSVPLQHVSRGASYRFRQPGDARPEPRTFQLYGKTGETAAAKNAGNGAEVSSTNTGPVFARTLPVLVGGVGGGVGYRQQPGTSLRNGNGSTFGPREMDRGSVTFRTYGGADVGRSNRGPYTNRIGPPTQVLPAPTQAITPPPSVITPGPRIAAPPRVYAAPRTSVPLRAAPSPAMRQAVPLSAAPRASAPMRSVPMRSAPSPASHPGTNRH